MRENIFAEGDTVKNFFQVTQCIYTAICEEILLKVKIFCLKRCTYVYATPIPNAPSSLSAPVSRDRTT